MHKRGMAKVYAKCKKCGAPWIWNPKKDSNPPKSFHCNSEVGEEYCDTLNILKEIEGVDPFPMEPNELTVVQYISGLNSDDG